MKNLFGNFMNNQEYESSLVIAVKIHYAKIYIEWLTERLPDCRLSSKKFYMKQLNQASRRLTLLQQLYSLYIYKNN